MERCDVAFVNEVGVFHGHLRFAVCVCGGGRSAFSCDGERRLEAHGGYRVPSGGMSEKQRAHQNTFAYSCFVAGSKGGRRKGDGRKERNVPKHDHSPSVVVIEIDPF